jgi:hypothetical protein
MDFGYFGSRADNRGHCMVLANWQAAPHSTKDRPQAFQGWIE